MKQVVLVDDYEFFAEEAKSIVERHNNAKCEMFSNPFTAIEHILNRTDVDILITDYQMPGMNGFELAQKVLERFPNIRVIISSAHDQETLQERCKQYDLEGKVNLASKMDIRYLVKLPD